MAAQMEQAIRDRQIVWGILALVIMEETGPPQVVR
jgi:hypothetical protein